MDKDKGSSLNNNGIFRSISNGLDSVLGTTYDNPKDSKTRATIHCAYHYGAGVITRNPREYERAKDQFNSGWGGSTDNLKKWDEKNNYKGGK